MQRHFERNNIAMNSTQQKPRTMVDIANMLGISKVSVSLALRNSPTISPELRDQVQQVAEEVGFKVRGYHRKSKAVQTASQFGRVAVLSTSENSSDPVAQLITNSVMKRLIHLKIEFSEFDVKQVNAEPELLANYAGLIYHYNFHPWEYPQFNGLAQVSIMNEEAELGSWDSYKPNEFFAGQLAANYLIGQGFVKAVIAYDSHWAYQAESHARLEGFRRQMRKAGVETTEFSYCGNDMPQEYLQALLAALENFNNRAGIFAFNDQVAYKVCHTLSFAGIVRRPGELEVVSCDNTYLIRTLSPPLPAVDLHIGEIASRAVDGLLWRIQNPLASFQQVLINPELVLPANL